MAVIGREATFGKAEIEMITSSALDVLDNDLSDNLGTKETVKHDWQKPSSERQR